MNKISESASILTGDEKSIKLDAKKVTKEKVAKKVNKETVDKNVTKETVDKNVTKETVDKNDTKEKETDNKEKVVNKREVKDKIKKATPHQKPAAVVKEDVNIIKKQKMPKTKLGLPVKNILVTPESIKKLWFLIKSR